MGESAPTTTHGIAREPLLRATHWARTDLLLIGSLLVYAAVNLFWQYLTSGDWLGSLSFSIVGYHRALVMPLSEVFQRPLGAFSYPWMIVVMGLVLSAVVFVPIVVAVLYRLPHVAAFLLVTALVGNAPVLALTLALGCFLAAATPLRSNLPLVAALLGMAPPALYLALASYACGDAPAILPVQRWIPYAPTIIAIACAILASAAVLWLTKLTRYRPGWVFPMALVLAAAPIWVFYQKVGPAELDYALIVNRLAGSCSIFDPARVEVWSRENNVDGLSNVKLRNFVQESYERRTRDLAGACDRFLGKYPRNWHAPALLYLKGQCQSLQLDQRSFESGTILLTETYAMPASRATWQVLGQDYHDSHQAALANWRLGELAMRECDMKQAWVHLRRAEEALRPLVSVQPRPKHAEKSPQLFTPLPEVPDRPHYEQALLEVRRLMWLMDSNDVLSDADAAEAMAAWRGCNPCQSDYYDGLVNLLRDRSRNRERTKLGNNIKLAVAKVTGDVEAMAVIAADDADPDAALQANFELGRLAMQKPSLVAESRLSNAQVYLQKVLDAPANPFTAQARQWMGAD